MAKKNNKKEDPDFPLDVEKLRSLDLPEKFEDFQKRFPTFGPPMFGAEFLRSLDFEATKGILPEAGFIDAQAEHIRDSCQSSVKEFLKKELINSGHEDICKELDYPPVFPRIKIYNHDSWNFVYVNDGSDEGKFIVSYSDWNSQLGSFMNRSIKAEMSFKVSHEKPYIHPSKMIRY